MIKCSKCGAENKPGAEVCRLCASPLSAPAPVKGGELRGESVRGEEVTAKACPACQTLNEVDWAFCQQCGARLNSAPPPTKPAPRSSGEEATVLVEAPPKVEAPATVWPPPSSTPPSKEVDPQMSLKTVPSQRAIKKPEASPVQQPGVPPAKKPDLPEPKAPVADQNKHPPQATEQVHSASLGTKGRQIICPLCSHPNGPESVFCSACGGVIQAAKTIAISSIPAPSKGRLHLVMEGGQSGEVYELKNETAIGRTGGDITFPHDGFMSSKHARIIQRGGSFILIDEGSRNGTFIKITKEVELKPGDMILIGRQLFRFEI